MSVRKSRWRAVIPAAGLGSRFLPLTLVMPKELLPLGELPLIHHAVLEVERAGFDEAVIVISPRKRGIRSYFEGDASFERALEARGVRDASPRLRAARELAERLHLRFVEKETKGPGEAALLANRLTGDDAFGLLLPDDVVLTVGHWHTLRHLHASSGAGVFCVRHMNREDSVRYGVAVCEPSNGRLRVRRLVEKPAPGTVDSPYRIFGRYIVTGDVLAALEARLRHARVEVQLTDGYAACLDSGVGVYAVAFDDDYYDCGTPSDYVHSAARYDDQTRRGTGGPLQVLTQEQA